MVTQQHKKLILKIENISGVRIAVTCICLMFLLGICLTLSSAACAATYWVSPNGKASWAACKSVTPLSGARACSLASANNNAGAGDTLYLRGGTYTKTSSSGCGNNYSCGVFPKNRGVSGARITYAAYSNEIPLITTDGTAPSWTAGITIAQGTSSEPTYIRVTGITFKNLPRWAELRNYASYNEIDHCTFYSDTGEDFKGAAGLAINSLCGGSSWSCYSKHNWIHHNTFSKVHENGNQSCHEGADMIRIGSGYPTADAVANASMEKDDYNTVEDNIIMYAGHALMDSYGGKGVIKNNIMYNPGWIADYSGGTCRYPPMPNGKYGHRGLQTTEDFARLHQQMLVEGNRFGWSSANPNNPGDANYAITSTDTIVRYNYSFGAHQTGIGTKWYAATTDYATALSHRGQGGYGPKNIRIYNNTTYWNGQTYPYMQSSQPGCSTCPGKLAGINVYSGALDVIVKNNISYNNYSYTLYGYDITVNSGKNPADYPKSIIEVNNWKTPNGDPKFVNPDVTDPKSLSLPNLTLQSTSKAIDGGTYLTEASGAGSRSIRLTVADAMYFQDGTWGSALARGVTLFPDWIAIGEVRNVVQISGIDYSSNTITLASPMTWNDKAPIWLYKKSDGAIVLVGAGPDLGASESKFGLETDRPSPPSNRSLGVQQ